MQVIGLTGSSGSGKSTVSSFCTTMGFTVIDGDIISREIAFPNSNYVLKLKEIFGDDVCDENGVLLRRKIAEIAFSSSENHKLLTNATTPFILNEINTRLVAIQKSGADICFMDGAVIIGTPFEPLCDKVISILSEFDMQVARIIKRDEVTDEVAKNRLNKQPDNDFFIAHSDIIIWNNQDEKHLLSCVKSVIQSL